MSAPGRIEGTVVRVDQMRGDGSGVMLIVEVDGESIHCDDSEEVPRGAVIEFDPSYRAAYYRGREIWRRRDPQMVKGGIPTQ